MSLFIIIINTVSAENCWEYDATDKDTCEAADTDNDGSADDCSWDSWGYYCMEKGCWDHWTQDSCSTANASGCFWQTEANMGWDDTTGWCEESADCWNYNTDNGCANVTGCQWKSSSCQGPSECSDYNDETNCHNSGYGCWWDYGDYCYNPGCWDYKAKTNCETNSCSWVSNSYCSEAGNNCWNYGNQTSCIAVDGCSWETYGDNADEGWCYKKGCWEYSTNTTCLADPSGNCGWDTTYTYCYEKGCHHYGTNDSTTGCVANPDEVIGGCQWTQNGLCKEPTCSDYSDNTTCTTKVGCFWSGTDNTTGTCKWEGCWTYNSDSTCSNTTGCQWKLASCNGDSGCSDYTSYSTCTDATESCWWSWGNYCTSLNCWSSQFSNNQTACETNTQAQGLDCKWDSYWGECWEKWCGEYSTENACNTSISGDCKWIDGWCQEENCWGYSDTATCASKGCSWDADYGYCEQSAAASCYDLNESLCGSAAYNNSCRWDQWGSYCTEKGCWDLGDNVSCTNANLSIECAWTETSEGWCEDSGTQCWDHYLQTDCEANNCTWDSWGSYCMTPGCWDHWTEPTCGNDSDCQWKTSSNSGWDWGWCEKRSCWNWDNTNASACVNTSFSEYSLNCSWDAGDAGEGWCYGPWQNKCWYNDSYMGGNESACVTNNISGVNCSWKAVTGWCYESRKTFSDFNTEGECLKSGWGKWNGTECITSGETMQNSGCWIFDGRAAECVAVRGCTYNSTSRECEGLATEGIQCNNITKLVVNNETNQSLCDVIPMLSTCCVWEAGQCQLTYDTTCWDQMAEAPVGATNCMDYNAIDSPTLCNQITGAPWYMPCNWNNVSGQCEFNDDMATDLDNIKTKRECESIGGTWKTENVCGTDNCAFVKQWCEMESGSSTYGCDASCWACNSSEACRASKKDYCQWTTDGNISQGGFCDIPDTLEIHGDCDKFCGSCEHYSGGDSTPEKACKASAAQCKWDNATENCVQKKSKGCSDDCFYCFDKEGCSLNGGGAQGTCKWDDFDGMCKPTEFDREICFDGEDNDNNDLIDCEDPTCMFDPFCGGSEMDDCWNYLDNASCAQNNCSWFQDPWTNTNRCGVKGENCWIYETNSTGCIGDINCQWYSDTHCAINHTKSDTCFKKTTQTGCEAVSSCKWESNSYSPQGGWCDFAPFECGWNQTLQQSKGNCESNSLCAWVTDPFSGTGWCETKCFARNSSGGQIYKTQATCNAAIAGGICEWSTGWCEPNSTRIGAVSGEDCAFYDNNITQCNNQPGCAWFEQAMMGSDFEHGMGGGFFGSQCDEKMSINCWDFRNQSACNGSLRNGSANATGDGDACRWVTEGTWSWCEPLGMHCGPMHAPINSTTDQPQLNNATCAGDQYCTLAEYEVGRVGCISKCHNTTLDETTCGQVANGNYCVWGGSGAGGGAGGGGGDLTMGGWCDPVGSQKIFKDMEGGAPHMLANDVCGSGTADNATKEWVDICGLGIKEMNEDYGMGMGLQAMTLAAACNGETLWDETTGSGRKTTKGFWYLDTDGVETGGCSSDDGANTGFEFKFIAKWEWSDSGLKEKLTAKRCLSGNWTAANIRLDTHTKKMCQELQGMLITVKKADLTNLPALFKPESSMRIYAASAGENNTAQLPSDTVGPGYYKSGTVDFKTEDCAAIGKVDKDTDGFYAYEDPDCKQMYLDEDKGFKSIEDCKTAHDDDMNGLTNCADPACKDEPVCGGSLAPNSSDHTTPEIKTPDVNELKTKAVIDFKTDERANGTLLFYKTDSSCSLLNATIRDRGLWAGNTSNNYTKYNFNKKIPINNLTANQDALNYSLSNGTTYFYKLKVCDISSNCAQSGCLNFTTKATAQTKTMKFTDPDANQAWTIDVNATGDYSAQGGGCGTSSNNSGSLGSLIDPEVNTQINLQQTQSGSGGNITVGIGGIDTSASKSIANLDMDVGTATGHESGSTENYVWINESGWGGDQGLHTQGAPDNVTIIMPGSDTYLYDCEQIGSNGAVTNCTDITDYATRSYNETTAMTTWTIPNPTADLWSYIVPQTPSTATPDTSSSSGGGGGGGGGAAVTTEAIEGESESRTWDKLKAGQDVLLVLSKDAIPVKEIKIKVKNAATNAELRVAELTQAPTTDETLTTVYKYLKMTFSNVADSDLESAEVTFKVTKSWLNEQGFTRDDVVLKRYKDGKWTELATEVVSQDTAKITFKSTTPGFSYFAVGIKKTAEEAKKAAAETGEEVVEEEQVAEEVSEQEEVTEEKETKKLNLQQTIIWIVVILVVLIAVLLIIEHKYKNQKIKKKK